MLELSKKYDHYRRRLRDAMKARNLTNEELAARLEAHPQTVSKLRDGRLTLRDEWRVRIAAALNIEESVLFGDEPLPAPTEFEIFRSAKRRGPRPANDNRDLPVFGLAAGSLAGHYVMTTEVMETVPRPPGLMGVDDAYALRTSGDSMIPRYFPREILYINPQQKVISGDHVVIQVQGHNGMGTETWVKRFDVEVDNEIVVSQYNPEARLHFRRHHVRHMHRVLPVNELFPPR